MRALRSIGGDADLRDRVRQDLGACTTDGSLIRSTGSINARSSAALAFTAIVPRIDAASNSAIPFSYNDGPMWAGRGLNTAVTAGLRADGPSFTVTLAPTLLYSQNENFAILPSGNPNRSAYASPWHSGIESADLPLRFGNQRITMLTSGESRVEIRAGGVSFGAATDEQWWGPGIENAIVLSNNAAGVPRVFAGTAHPIATPIGRIEAMWFVGGLTESLYFDRTDTNDTRSLSAFVATLRLAVDTGLTLGIARSVYAPVRGASGIASHALDAAFKWNQTADTTGPAPANPSDQVLSAFARWVFPESRIEVYGEWATVLPLLSIRQLLVAPQLHDGFTAGLQWAKPFANARALRVQSEITTLEQTPPSVGASIPSFYVSHFVPQGYTQRGQILGAAIGTGASSQWITSDYLAPRWCAGVVLGRIRWEDEAYYRQPSGIGHFNHDVSLIGGVRAAGEVYGSELSLELLHMQRLNYLFQTTKSGYTFDSTFDVRNITLRMSIVPFVR